jgi:hypothetical protein
MTPFSNTFNLHPSLSVRDQVSQPYKTRGKCLYFNFLLSEIGDGQTGDAELNGSVNEANVLENVVVELFLRFSISSVNKVFGYRLQYVRITGRDILKFSQCHLQRICGTRLVTYPGAYIITSYTEINKFVQTLPLSLCQCGSV